MIDRMTAALDTRPAGTVVHITGDLDYETAQDLRTLLSTIVLSSGRRLVLDLSGLRSCDSSGITTILAARNLALAAQAVFALAAVPDQTARILRLTGIDRILPRYPDAESAMRAP
ncbi:MAG TPA: STAS domain-containing protein [Actinospica sp.]|jgi:anti-anti-sigma factor|nr:STAS domain-containing protein [Actinospica sp.]